MNPRAALAAIYREKAATADGDDKARFLDKAAYWSKLADDTEASPKTSTAGREF